MRWKKLGKIFDPADHKLPERCFGYAQSPQAVVFDDFVRIFFSTREKDSDKTYLSHVSFADFDKRFTRILRVSEKPVIPLGELGTFDEHGIFPMNVLRDGNRIHAYTTGWNRKVSVSADASVGYAYSDDNGLSFTKLGHGPVLTASMDEPFLVCDAFVQKFNGIFHMWYIFGQRWFEDKIEKVPQRVYKIAHAESVDGITWKRKGVPIISDKIDMNECQALPTVVPWQDKFLMFFCYRHASGFRTDPNKGYRIGCAVSNDLQNWTRDDNFIKMDMQPGEWDSDMMCYPFSFIMDNEIYLLYNGNEFGKSGFGIAKLEA